MKQQKKIPSPGFPLLALLANFFPIPVDDKHLGSIEKSARDTQMTTRVPSFLASSGFAARCSRACTPLTNLALPSRPLHMGVTPRVILGRDVNKTFFFPLTLPRPPPY